ncbi:hypothetical protein FT663_01752 [Candidozyma haemuli var. vulneris]|uniref:MICOS complex subunit MIC60 n=1 Tax=Candidozyma haemuli TaxID=45357 RepID=A0A2V1AS34_9ASCO|nr:hypothetical protein CXQ85_002338 [[Candida] haemuloni]KAF3989508.1 hypothetical protein FT662_02777 [[Candida] haemuloni var. vulneris]KAF3993763.1 hypothetical protein FT663_01752 [[Candida] haemuloni var. vulneris]PVH20544.1 hypothetical protein CXQ85_002338 [[Candida] haemuloni]
MFSAVARRAVTQSAQCAARRSLTTSIRSFQDLNTRPGSPVTSQPVKANANPQATSPSVKEEVKRINENPEDPTKKKKKFSFTGFLFKTLLFTSVVYGATLYVATKNDKVMDFVIDQNLPYSEELIELIETGSIEELQKSLGRLPQNIKLPSKDQIDQLTSKIEKGGETLIKETKSKFSKSNKTGYTTPEEQLQKPVEIESAGDVIEKLPMIKLKDGLSDFADDTVTGTIKSFNDLIALVDASNLGPQKDGLIKNINENVHALTSKLVKLSTSLEEELQKKLKTTQTELLSDYTQKELELTQNLLDQFNHEKSNLEKKYKARVTEEVEAAKAAITQAAVNATTMVRVEQTKRFQHMVKQKIDEERDGRLRNLDALNQRLEELEKYAQALEEQAVAANNRGVIQSSLTKLKSLIFATEANTPAKFLTPYVNKIDEVTSKSQDEVFSLALKELQPLLAQESNQSILSVPQLLTAWEELTPELRSASLLPPNAGLLGHVASVIFSKFLLPVKGNKPDGKDIESVIARVNSSLVRGQLDVAVEEVANLKGWSRKLADDWVKEARVRLEAEFLIGLIDAESKIV